MTMTTAVYDKSDVREKSCQSCPKLSLKRIEDYTDNNDNTCMTEVMYEKKLSKLSQVVLERIEDNTDNNDNSWV